MTRSGTTRRAFPGDVHATVADAGVGDQEDNTCRNGTPRCPGPNADVPALPCSACFFEEDSDDDPELLADGGKTIQSDSYVGGTIRTYCRYCHQFAVFDLEEDGRTCRSCDRFIRTLGRGGWRMPDWGDQFQSLQIDDAATTGGEF